ncbi:T9SS type A sorting domain-containing protein [Pontibacter sp. KCTC 32443]|uniref:T9SS type A sorting domain-containing protein n=1 Tax=Pontibacter TaxID=323449 RepID=UPI00164DDDDE|nr:MULTISPECIES: T9SS type A sorting domain-containing protein [Pontibacter]MBC5774836.1 T9SS type A sorting domain-containing protein [Pontibacter sp. KCTC 32443]
MKNIYLLAVIRLLKFKHHKRLLATFCFLISLMLQTQAQEKEWDKAFGGSRMENFSSIQQTTDGGFILGGTSNSNASAEKSENSKGGDDFWIVKLDASGNKVWDRTIGGEFSDYLSSVQQTKDGGYILGGMSNSGISGDKTQDSRGDADYWIVKLDAAGNIVWDKTFGGSDLDWLIAVSQTQDEGYILGGSSHSNISGDKSENSKGSNDYWVVRVDASGNKVWDFTIGGTSSEFMRDIIATTDGGFIIGGESNSGAGGDKSEALRGGSDYWIVKLDEDGNKVWDKTYGGNDTEWLFDLSETSDRGIVAGGISYSDISGDKSQPALGSADYWVLKLDENGNKEWDKTFGGTETESLASVQQTHDGGYLLGGTSNSGISGDKTEASRGDYDFWMVKMDASGNKVWDKTLGGRNYESDGIGVQTKDGSYIVAGSTGSGIGGDKTELSRGDTDYWVVKLTPEVSPLPPYTCRTIDFEHDALGLTFSTFAIEGDVLIHARKRNQDGTYATGNHAAIFNTLSPTGDDSDLYTEDWGNVLIINQDLGDEPNDNPWGGEITLDFSAFGPVTMTSLKALDFDVYEDNSWVYLYDGEGNELYKVQIHSLGNNSKQEIDLGNTKGVMKMKVVLDGFNAAGMLAGSGAIDDIKFCIETETPLTVSAGPDKFLNCKVSEVMLSGSSATEGVTFAWSGPGGFTSTSATPTVSVAGTYTLTVTDPATGASASDNVLVLLDVETPDFEIEKGISGGYDTYLTCNNSEVRVIVKRLLGGSAYSWTGPNGFTSDQSGFSATVPGTYTLTLTDTITGCQATKSVFIGEFIPDLNANAGPDKVLTCKDKTVTLTGSANTFAVIWSTTDGHIVSGQRDKNLVVDMPGTYVITAIDLETSCTETDTVVVTLDMEAPNVTAQGGTLSSETGTVQLTGSSTTEGVAYSWAGPDGYTSAEQNPVVSVAGEYTLTVTDVENGCTSTATVTVAPQATTQTSAISQATVFPNPIERKGAVEFKLLTSGNYVVELYDLKGNLIRELKAGHATAGELVTVELDGNGLKGGLYIARIMSANESKTIKLILKK